MGFIMRKELNKLPQNRFAYLDNVRSFVIFIVVAQHSAVTYSGFGDWFYVEGSPDNLSVFGSAFFGLIQSLNQAWMMGALFFISAYLTTKALVRHGTLEFIKERLFRLGLPLLLFIFIVTPFILFVLLGSHPGLGDFTENSLLENYMQFLTKFWWLRATGPLWYVQVLLIFCFIYIIIKKCFPKPYSIKGISNTAIVFTIIITGISAFLIRLVLPIGTNVLNLQLCYFASYIVMFIAGILIGENDLIDDITSEKNITWLKLSLIIGIPIWALLMLFGGALEGETYFNGGFNWQSFIFALWEALIAIGFSIGIIALFKKKANFNNKLTRLVKDNAFGLYFFHAPIMVAISLSLIKLVLNPIMKFIVVLIAAFIVTLLFSYLLRKIKPIKILLK